MESKTREVREAQEQEQEQEAKGAEPAGGLRRREVLQAGLAGVAAAVVGSRAGEARATEAAHGAAEASSGKAKTEDLCDPGPVSPTPTECLPLDLQGAQETWNEPWVWRPGDWPGQQLDLNVVVNQNPGIEVGLGNPGSVFFSYGGNTPGPTIRMRGDETLFVKLRNLLGEDCGSTFVGPFPDLNDLPSPCKSSPKGCGPQQSCFDSYAPSDPKTCDGLEELQAKIIAKGQRRGQYRFDFCLGEHTNGLHSAHVTNLHTHGLHVRPDKNPDGTHSDNVILRVLPQGDFLRRERAVQDLRDTTCPSCGHHSEVPVCPGCGANIESEPACGADSAPNSPLSVCQFLRQDDQIYLVRDDEVVAEADYEFRLGNLPRFPVHPPGTHWYHPHAHGATDIQVSSGMAGYLIIEGDVDDAINCAMTGSSKLTEGLKTGPFDYRERLMFMQRVFPLNIEGDPQSPISQLKKRPSPTANGSEKAGVINLRRGAIERWRVINGSVDGRGFKHFMVVKGQYEVITTGFQASGVPCAELFWVDPRDTTNTVKVTLRNYRQLIEDKKCTLYQLSTDGVTLVEKAGDTFRYTIKDLSQQNAGTKNPIAQPCEVPGGDRFPSPTPPADPTPAEKKYPGAISNAERLCRLQSVFEDCDSVKNTWVRPNEYYMGPANRTDVFFQMPDDAKCGDVYTVLAKASLIHADTPMFNLQQKVQDAAPAPAPVDIVIAHIVVVDDEPVPAVQAYEKDPSSYLKQHDGVKPHHKVMSLKGCLPDAPPYLFPVTDDELKDSDGKFRTRYVQYSGWGNEGLPLVTDARGDREKGVLPNPSAGAFSEFIEKDKGELELLRYAEHDGVNVLLSPRIRTMSIDGRKFNPTDPDRPQVLVNTCEQWVLYNTGQTLWAYTDTGKEHGYSQQGQFNGHYVAFPIDRETGDGEFWSEGNFDNECKKADFRIVTRGIDHPFHIHQNPFWVMRIEIPDRTGKLCNILDEPRWMDSLLIPRNNGRVVFRSRFPDFVGASVHHCHILQHEDNGMMTSLQLTPFAGAANNKTLGHAIPGGPDAGASDATLKRPTPQEAYVLNFSFIDPNMPMNKDRYVVEPEYPDVTPDTGQVYPGFTPVPPEFPPPKPKKGWWKK